MADTPPAAEDDLLGRFSGDKMIADTDKPPATEDELLGELSGDKMIADTDTPPAAEASDLLGQFSGKKMIADTDAPPPAVEEDSLGPFLGRDVDTEKLREKLSQALERICQECFIFVNYVNVVARVTFKVDDAQKTEVVISQMVAPGPIIYSDSKEFNTPVEIKPQIKHVKTPKGRSRGVKTKVIKPLSVIGAQQLSFEKKTATPGKKKRKKGRPSKSIQKEEDDDDTIEDSESLPKADVLVKLEQIDTQVPVVTETVSFLTDQLDVEVDPESDSETIQGDDEEGQNYIPDENDEETDVDEDIKYNDEDEDYKPPKKKTNRKATRGDDYNINITTDPLQCYKCQLIVETDELLRQHKLKVHGRYVCEKCPYVNDSKTKYQIHYQAKHSDTKLPCDECDQEFSQLDTLKKHVKVMHSDYWRCPSLCEEPKSNSSKKKLMMHLKTEHQVGEPGNETQVFACDYCKMVFLSQEEAENHNTQVHVHICGLCMEKFETVAQLVKHKLSIHPDVALNAGKRKSHSEDEDCSVYTPKRQKTSTAQNNNPLCSRTCEICDKVFTSKSVMVRHKLIHFDRPYVCPLCGKGFVERNKLKLHLQGPIHKGQEVGEDLDKVFKLDGPQYRCYLCGHAFTLKSAFKSHRCQSMRIKAGRFRCEECDEDFKNQDFLQDHLDTWHSDEPQVLEESSKSQHTTPSKPVELNQVTTLPETTGIDLIEDKPVTTRPKALTFQMNTSKRIKLAIQHLKDTKQKPWCSVCRRFFHSYAVYYHHMSTHKGAGVECLQCKKHFEHRRSLQMHMNLVHGLNLKGERVDLNTTCSVCNRAFCDIHSLRRHSRSHTGQFLFCDICGKRFIEAFKLRRHIDVHHSGVRYRCTECRNEYKDPSTLAKHLARHKAGLINNTSRLRQNLEIPKHRHCDPCNETFNTRKLFMQHIRKMHRENKKMFMCEFCPKIFSKAYALQHHREFVHLGVKHQCHLCEKSYFKRSYLEKHLKQHETNTLPVRKRVVRPTSEPYCEICDKKFSQWGGLQRHMRKHNGTGHTCEYCGKMYTEKIKLKQHISTVHEKVRWKCPHCDKAYTTERYLNEHLREHAQLFEFFCRLCGRGFSSKGRCAQHERRHKMSDWEDLQSEVIEVSHTEQGQVEEEEVMKPVIYDGSQGHRIIEDRTEGRGHGDLEVRGDVTGEGIVCQGQEMIDVTDGDQSHHIVEVSEISQGHELLEGVGDAGTGGHGQIEVTGSNLGEVETVVLTLTKNGVAVSSSQYDTMPVSSHVAVPSDDHPAYVTHHTHAIINNAAVPSVGNVVTTSSHNVVIPPHINSMNSDYNSIHLNAPSIQRFALPGSGQIVVTGNEVSAVPTRAAVAIPIHEHIPGDEQASFVNREVFFMHQCDICSRVCPTKSALHKHLLRHKDREGAKVKCDVCHKEFTGKGSLFHHKRGMHGKEKKYKCELCGQTFNFHHSLKLHKYKHSGVRPHACSMCPKSYLTSNHLKNHVEAVHSGQRKYVCPVCNKAFTYDNSLRMHMLLHESTRPFLCDICSKTFVSKSALKAHEELHTTEMHQCTVCQKMYNTRMLLRAHMRRHTDEGHRYMCDICGNTFMYRSTLQAHIAVHGDSRTYECPTCHKTFKTYATLYSHRLVHVDANPHPCSVCGKGFKTRERMKAHERRHTGEKPYKCELCGSCFPDRGGLSKHNKTVHARRPRFQCPSCGKLANRADNLRVHMKMHNDPRLMELKFEELLIMIKDGEPEPDYEDMPIPMPRRRRSQPLKREAGDGGSAGAAQPEDMATELPQSHVHGSTEQGGDDGHRHATFGSIADIVGGSGEIPGFPAMMVSHIQKYQQQQQQQQSQQTSSSPMGGAGSSMGGVLDGRATGSMAPVDSRGSSSSANNISGVIDGRAVSKQQQQQQHLPPSQQLEYDKQSLHKHLTAMASNIHHHHHQSQTQGLDLQSVVSSNGGQLPRFNQQELLLGGGGNQVQGLHHSVLTNPLLQLAEVMSGQPTHTSANLTYPSLQHYQQQPFLTTQSQQQQPSNTVNSNSGFEVRF